MPMLTNIAKTVNTDGLFIDNFYKNIFAVRPAQTDATP